MLKDGALVLTIEGKASQRIVKKFNPAIETKMQTGWFFVDFVQSDIPLHTVFDVLLEGESKKLVSGPGSVQIKLLNCLDQFGNKLSFIPKGYNAICRLHFSPHIPSRFRQLPTLSGWDYNRNALTVARHADIELAIPDAVIKDVFGMLVSDMKNKFAMRHIENFSRNEFSNHLERIYHAHLQADKILESLMQLGQVTQKEADVMEFTATTDS